jgi:hypothetical protein
MAGMERSATPTAEDRAAGRAIVSQMQGLPRPMWVTASPQYSVLGGQPGLVAHTMALVDVLKGGGAEAQAVHAMLHRHVREQRFRTIVLDRAAGFLPGDIVHLIRTRYRPAGNLAAGKPPLSFFPRSGAWVRPEEVWVAR